MYELTLTLNSVGCTSSRRSLIRRTLDFVEGLKHNVHWQLSLNHTNGYDVTSPRDQVTLSSCFSLAQRIAAICSDFDSFLLKQKFSWRELIADDNVL